MPVHKELLCSQSPVVAAHCKMAGRYRQVEKDLFEAQAMLAGKVGAELGKTPAFHILGNEMFLQSTRRLGTPDDLGPLFKKMIDQPSATAFMFLGNHFRPNQYPFRNCSAETVSAAVASCREEIEKTIQEHHDISRLSPGPLKVAIQDRMVLHAATPRTVEMLIHAVYTGKLERMDGWGFLRGTGFDYESVYELADALELRSLQTQIYNETGEDRFRKHDSSIMPLNRY